MSVSLHELAQALGGELSGGQVRAPGPGHSPRDRSLSVKLSASASNGFITNTFAGDPFDACRDHVAAKLGLAQDRTSRRRDVSNLAAPTSSQGLNIRTSRRREVSNVPAPEQSPDHAARIARAINIWAESREPRGTVVQRYLESRGLELGDDIAGRAVRFHSRCPWTGDDGKLKRIPAMVTVLRDIRDDIIKAVQRTWLSEQATKIDRRMLGPAAGAAIKIDADEDVTLGLHVGEGFETVLSGRQLGFRPAWALGSAGAIASFPVLAGVECLTILAEHDPANERAVATCAERWHEAGREVTIVEPQIGNDLNDATRGAA